jgi:hypothetical protein
MKKKCGKKTKNKKESQKKKEQTGKKNEKTKKGESVKGVRKVTVFSLRLLEYYLIRRYENINQSLMIKLIIL